MIDFSIIPSFECNLSCPFCMYDAGPDNKAQLDFELTKRFIDTWDWAKINNVGFYGGEPSINLPLYQKFIDLIPEGVLKFIITNGAWSRTIEDTVAFAEFSSMNSLYVIVSGTMHHIMHQNRDILAIWKEAAPETIRLKGSDVITKMGRGKNYPGALPVCSGFCRQDDRPTRLAIKPDGTVMFQNCKGHYPFVQDITVPFNGIEARIDKAVALCRSNNGAKQHKTKGGSF